MLLDWQLQSSRHLLPVSSHGGLCPLLRCTSAILIFPCPVTLLLNPSLYSLFLVMSFISAVFGIQLKMGAMFLCQEQLHSFYFYSFNNFSFCVSVLYQYCLERDLWEALQPCACQYLPGILTLILLSCGLW